jgi:transcriptional regulator with XRE-family HTH domain
MMLQQKQQPKKYQNLHTQYQMKTAEKFLESLSFKDDFEKIEFFADSIQLDILHQLTDKTDIKQTDIAKKMGVSNSFVSQLFSGDKHLSLYHLATLIYYFDLELKFDLKPRNKGKIINLGEYFNVRKESYCLDAENMIKYHPKRNKEEETRKICSV